MKRGACIRQDLEFTLTGFFLCLHLSSFFPIGVVHALPSGEEWLLSLSQWMGITSLNHQILPHKLVQAKGMIFVVRSLRLCLAPFQAPQAAAVWPQTFLMSAADLQCRDMHTDSCSSTSVCMRHGRGRSKCRCRSSSRHWPSGSADQHRNLVLSSADDIGWGMIYCYLWLKLLHFWNERTSYIRLILKRNYKSSLRRESSLWKRKISRTCFFVVTKT